jgi:hypothetical protein
MGKQLNDRHITKLLLLLLYTAVSTGKALSLCRARSLAAWLARPFSLSLSLARA